MVFSCPFCLTNKKISYNGNIQKKIGRSSGLMKVIVVEDILSFNEKIRRIANQVLMEENLDIKIIPYLEYNKDLKKIIHNNEIKIYILDYDLGEKSQKNGYDISREIRGIAHDWCSIIIICSIHNKQKNFISSRLSILTYLSKSDNFEHNLRESIKEAIYILNQTSTISITNRCTLYYNEVLYALKEKYSKYCVIKTFDNEFRVRKNIYELEEELHLKKFKRHLLANEKNIASVDDDEITFKNEEKIKL